MVEEVLLMFAAVTHTFGVILESPPRSYTRSWLLATLDESLRVVLELEGATPLQRQRCEMLFELMKRSLRDA